MSFRQHSSFRAPCIERLDGRILLAGDVLAPPVHVFLSDITPDYVMNGFGPIEVNSSNGEEIAGDGKSMRLNGKRYDHGIGVHSYSEIRYTLNGEFRSFVSDVGIDDEVGTNGSVIFQVYADKTKLFDSDVMTGHSDFKRVNLDVAGRNLLTLIVRDAGDGTDSDHADWAGAHLRRNVGKLPVIRLAKRVTLDEPGSVLRLNGSFDDISRTSSQAPLVTVDWGDNSGIKRIELSGNDDTDFTLRHKFDPAMPGTYDVIVHVNNGQATGVATCKVAVNNTAPSNVALSNADAQGRLFTLTGLEFVGYGVFEDPGTVVDEAHTYRVDYGDGTPVETGNVPALFFLHHTYQAAGTYTVATSIIDSAGNVGSGTNTVVVTDPKYVYISDLDPTGVNDGTISGFTRDANSKNGGDIKLNGKRFSKGLGVTANSDLSYDLAHQYRSLLAEIGVDDYGSGASSVIFHIYADGNELFNSGPMNNQSATQSINLDITGAETLRLTVTDASNGTHPGFADWAGARFI